MITVATAIDTFSVRQLTRGIQGMRKQMELRFHVHSVASFVKVEQFTHCVFNI